MILITGQAGVGKTTLAKLIAKEAFNTGQIPVLMSFAGPLKEEASRKGYDKETNPEKYRSYCQEIGAARREEDADYWVKKFDDALQTVVEQENEDIANNTKYWERVVIVDDCRYVNELAYGILYDACTLFMSYGNRHIEEFEWRSHPSEFMSQSIESGDDVLMHQFTDIVFNEGTQKDLTKIVKANFPIWCGTEVEIDDLDIPKDKPAPLQELVDNLIDLLYLADLDTEEEEDDDDTEESDD